MSVDWLNEHKIMRRVGGRTDYRLHGLTDLLVSATGMSVLDLGCNRGMVAKDFADRGATLVHGCDIDEPSIFVSRSVFIDIREVKSQFEVVDLTGGAASLSPFGAQRYDTILMIATYHKLKRIMPAQALSDLIRHLGTLCLRYFAWRGTSEKHHDNEMEMKAIDANLGHCGMSRIHTSYISRELGVAAIWSRRQ